MPETEIVQSTGGDSAGNTATAAVAPGDANAGASHASPTAGADDSATHIDWLSKNQDKLPPEFKERLERPFKQDYTSKLNQLNLIRNRVEESAGGALKNAGVEIPEGKTVSDLLYEQGGKGFTDLVGKTVEQRIAPITAQIDAQRLNENLRQQMGLAQNIFPAVKENFAEAVAAVDRDKDLSAMAMYGNGQALPYVLDYAAQRLTIQKRDAEITELRKKLDGAKVANKAGTSTSKSSGGTAKPTSELKPGSPDYLRKLAAEKYAELAD
jgi:hypothetical protein